MENWDVSPSFVAAMKCEAPAQHLQSPILSFLSYSLCLSSSSTELNFINILCTALVRTEPKSVKKADKLSILFLLFSITLSFFSMSFYIYLFLLIQFPFSLFNFNLFLLFLFTQSYHFPSFSFFPLSSFSLLLPILFILF